MIQWFAEDVFSLFATELLFGLSCMFFPTKTPSCLPSSDGAAEGGGSAPLWAVGGQWAQDGLGNSAGICLTQTPPVLYLAKKFSSSPWKMLKRLLFFGIFWYNLFTLFWGQHQSEGQGAPETLAGWTAQNWLRCLVTKHGYGWIRKLKKKLFSCMIVL